MNRQGAREPGDVLEEPGEALDRLATDVLDAAVEVHRHLGPGFLESVYERSLCEELTLRGSGRLVVELKAVEAIDDVHLAQVRAALKATKLRLGLVINFNVPVLLRGVRRIVLTR